MAKKILIALVLVTTSGINWAANVTVKCGGGGEEVFTSISAALAQLDPRQSNTITVYGACNENLFISNFDGRLTLNATPGASISDASGGTNDVILINQSPRVIINGFTIDGAVRCQIASTCQFSGNSFQGSPRAGVAIVGFTGASFSGDTISNAKAQGLVITETATAGANDIKVTGSGGAGVLVWVNSDLNIANSTLQSNGRQGIRVADHSALHIIGSTVTGNAFSGISVESGSEALFSVFRGAGNVITGNGGYGVRVADLSFANFESPGNNISGNNTVLNIGQPNVACLPQFSATRGALTNIGTGGTNCIEP